MKKEKYSILKNQFLDRCIILDLDDNDKKNYTVDEIPVLEIACKYLEWSVYMKVYNNNFILLKLFVKANEIY